LELHPYTHSGATALPPQEIQDDKEYEIF